MQPEGALSESRLNAGSLQVGAEHGCGLEGAAAAVAFTIPQDLAGIEGSWSAPLRPRFGMCWSIRNFAEVQYYIVLVFVRKIEITIMCSYEIFETIQYLKIMILYCVHLRLFIIIQILITCLQEIWKALDQSFPIYHYLVCPGGWEKLRAALEKSGSLNTLRVLSV